MNSSGQNGCSNSITAWKVFVFQVFLVRMRENTYRWKNFKYGHFSRNVWFFSQVILQEIGLGSHSRGFRYFAARNKLRTFSSQVWLFAIFNYSTEHLHFSGHCNYCLLVYWVRTKKIIIIFPGSKQTSQRNASVYKKNASFNQNNKDILNIFDEVSNKRLSLKMVSFI